VKRSKLAAEKNAFVNASWKTVQQQLDEKSSAIEFVRYKTGNKKTDSVLYGALIITKNTASPVFVELCSEEKLKKLLYRFEKNGGDLYHRGLSIKVKKGISASKDLYNLVWQPIEKHLVGIEEVFYTPDGLLHRIAFAALPVSDSTLLLQRYGLSQLFSTRDANTKTHQQRPTNILLAGGIDYNNGITTNTNTTTPFSFVYNRSSGMAEFRFLPGTLQEVQLLKDICDRNKITSTIFTGSSATETAFRMLSGKAPSVIHISTHGFSLPGEEQSKDMNNSFTAASDPLLRCGLVMAGGNTAWKTKQAGSSSDGILTGKEISTINLRGCELAVLSACETGLGNIQGTEGVFGLQRALKTAGVRSVIVSLWPIPDKETVEFMQLFYTHWFNTGDKEKAFRHAQLEMQKKYEASLWAAFVLIQ
jgi:CHAT domain-containing protein